MKTGTKPFLRPISDIWTHGKATEKVFYDLYNEALDEYIDLEYPISEDLVDKVKFRAKLKNRLSNDSYVMIMVIDQLKKRYNLENFDDIYND